MGKDHFHRPGSGGRSGPTIGEINEKKQERAALIDKARAVLDGAERDRLGFEEQQKYDRIMQDVRALGSEVEDMESKMGSRFGRTDMSDHDNDLPSFGGEGRFIGHDKKGREVRSFRAADSLYQFHKERDGFADWWEEADNPLGKFLRAVAVGPQDDWERRALSSTAGGGDLIPDPIRLMTLDDLKAQSVLGRAGAQFVSMDSASLAITRVDSPASHSWSAEGTTAATTDADFQAVTLNAETLRGIHKANRELVQDAPDFPRVLENELTGSLRAELQRVAFVGSGSNNEPQGLYNSTGDGVTKLDFGGTTSGTAPASSAAAYDEILRAREQLLNANVPESGQSYVWAPRTDRQFGSLKDANHQPLQRPPALDGVRELVTTSVPTTLAPSTGLTGQSAIFYGRYRNLVVGMRLHPSVEILRERYAQNYRLGFLSALRADVAPERPDSFTILDRVSS